MTLFNLAEAEMGITHVTVRGLAGPYEKAERFPLTAVAADKVFWLIR